MTTWTAKTVGMNGDILDRIERAVLKVRERLLRSTMSLNELGVPYAVVGGNAVASWVATIDEGAVRTTRDVDLLMRRSDLPVITMALEQVGFVYDNISGLDMFRDGIDGKPSDVIHLMFAGEKMRPDHLLPTPEIETVDDAAHFRVIALESLLRMKLMSNRRKDQVPIQDMIGVKLIDETWLANLPPILAERLQQILDTPEM